MGRQSLFKKTERSKVNREIFVLTDEQTNFLEELSYKVRSASGYKLSKSEIVRALIGFLKKKDIDVSKIDSEQDIIDQLMKV